MSNLFQLGLWSFLQAPSHIMLLFGLGLLAGQQGWRGVRIMLPVFVLALVVGLMLTQMTTFAWNPEFILLLLVVVTGGLLAVRLELPGWSLGLLAIVTGILIGLDSAPGLIPGMKVSKLYAALAGVGVGLSLAALLPALAGLLLRLPLNGIILRILGSWVVASALMVLALMFLPR